MNIFTKKIAHKYFEDILSGRKKWELRLADFNISEGDILVLEEWDGNPRVFTGRKLEKKVTYLSKFKIDEFFNTEDEIKKYGLQIISFD